MASSSRTTPGVWPVECRWKCKDRESLPVSLLGSLLVVDTYNLDHKEMCKGKLYFRQTLHYASFHREIMCLGKLTQYYDRAISDGNQKKLKK